VFSCLAAFETNWKRKCLHGIRKASAAAENFPGEGQNSAGAAVPLGYAVETEEGGREGGNLSLRPE
jgi:hypothetical protein